VSRWRRGAGALAVVAVAATSACSAGDGDGDGAPATSTSTTSPAATTSTTEPVVGTLDQVTLATQEVAVLEEPTAFAARPSGPNLYVAEKGGRIRVIEVTEATSTTRARYQLLRTPLLDLSDEVTDRETEQGLLGLAFSSDGRSLYVSFTAEPDGRSVVLEYRMGDRATVDTSTRRELLEVEQPFDNHNGGNLVTGPDGYLYIGLGDGGGGGDPLETGQDPTTLLGSILRVDPEAPSGDLPYGIPAGNPFADGEDGARETWLYGVRNPWRFSFDRATGDLWVADVGQSSREEIDFLPAVGGFDAGRGANLGWNEMEGSEPFEGGSNPEGAILPVYEYGRDGGCSITGGYVYRGDVLPPLQGAYLYADYCSAGIRAIQIDGQQQVIDDRTFDLPVDQVQSFGQDNDGELYVLLAGGPVLKLVSPEDPEE